jgi:hypothetical protein
MLTPRLTNDIQYTSIPFLIKDIDDALLKLANELYKNTVYSLNRCIDYTLFDDLLNYKRILKRMQCNCTNTCNSFTLQEIASRVIKLVKSITADYINILTTTTTTTSAIDCNMTGNATVVYLDCELCGICVNLSINPSYC